jgi:predicted O-methyltransferase YrrM
VTYVDWLSQMNAMSNKLSSLFPRFVLAYLTMDALFRKDAGQAIQNLRTFHEEERLRKHLLEKYGCCQLPTIDLLDMFPNFSETIANYSFLEGTSLITDLALLKLLAKRYDECQYLEIGLWRGESLAIIAEVCKDCTSVSLSPDELRNRGFSENVIDVHGFFSSRLKNANFIRHDSTTFDFQSLNKKFDLIFIDGDHSCQAVRTDTSNAFKLLRSDRSVVVWHDYGYSPETVRPSVLAGILDGCPEEERTKLYHVSNTMCAIYTVGTYKTRYITFPEVPDKSFRVEISGSRCESS